MEGTFGAGWPADLACWVTSRSIIDPCLKIKKSRTDGTAVVSMRMIPHWLTCLNTWFPAGGNGLKDQEVWFLLEEVYHRGRLGGFKRLAPFPVLSVSCFPIKITITCSSHHAFVSNPLEPEA